jgi:nitrile hydratase accessory protein
VTATPDIVRAALSGVEPPTASGEPVFAEPWEGRAYGLALETVERLGLPWEAFRQRLIAAIAAAPERPYYASWVAALEDLVLAHGAGTIDELRIERAECAAYRYDEGGVDIEVTPIHGGTSQRELYRCFADGVAVRWGRRAFGATGELTSDEPLSHDDWTALRDHLLSFESTPPG